MHKGSLKAIVIESCVLAAWRCQRIFCQREACKKYDSVIFFLIAWLGYEHTRVNDTTH
jgi:hypothetical protein